MAFKVKFLENYFPIVERNDKRKKILELIQGNMIVREYTTQFLELVRATVSFCVQFD